MGPDESKRALAENSQALCVLPVDKALKGGNGHKGAKVIRGERSEEGNLIRDQRCTSVRFLAAFQCLRSCEATPLRA